MKAMEAFADPLDVPFQLSGAVTREGFAAHVEKFDAKRQLLFQEEFEVREGEREGGRDGGGGREGWRGREGGMEGEGGRVGG